MLNANFNLAASQHRFSYRKNTGELIVGPIKGCLSLFPTLPFSELEHSLVLFSKLICFQFYQSKF